MANLSEVQTYPPKVTSTHAKQRWFQAGTADQTLCTDFAELHVFRFADWDMAELELVVRNGSASRASVITRLSASQLRALAQRLLDAAADLEAHPSHELLAQSQEVPA